MPNLFIPSVISRTTKSVDWLFDQQLEARDAIAERQQDCRAEIERSIDFLDVLEEACDFNPAQREEFMKALDRGNAQDLHLIHCLLLQAKESIVKRRMAGGGL